MDFAVWQELAVAGCIFALQTEDAAKSVFETRAGRKALSRAVKYECHEILAVPQVQAYLECRWVGVQTKSELEELKKPLVIFENFWLLGVKVLCLTFTSRPALLALGLGSLGGSSDAGAAASGDLGASGGGKPALLPKKKRGPKSKATEVLRRALRRLHKLLDWLA